MLTWTQRWPVFTALAALVLYLCTMGSGVTVNSMGVVAKVAGWDDTPLVGQPVLWVLLLPLHILPVAWVPVALKIFSAVLAAAILGLLGRTLQLLPLDREWVNPGSFAVALPALAACVLCGLEFSFWQEATATCGELLDLLLFATALWLLLEYKACKEPRWLNAAVLIWGLGMAQNWLMLITLPLFVAGIIWVMGLRFFRWDLILRLAFFGLMGFSTYALLPMVNGLAPHSHWTLGESWLNSLRQTKNVFLTIYYQFWKAHRLLSLAVVICFLVPTLPLFVRLRDAGTRNISGVDQFQLWIYRCLRLGLLLACIWLAFDPIPAARQMIHHEMGPWLTMLTFDYLNALGAGFIVGNLLLIAHGVVPNDFRRSRRGLPWKTITTTAAACGIILVAGGLVARNAPAIAHLNFHPIEKAGALAANSLPAGRGVVLCDFPQKLLVFEAALAHRHDADAWLPVDTRILPTVEYRTRLEQRQPLGWLTDATRHELTPVEMIQLLTQISRTNRLFYLHPSFGHFFEAFYLEPTGAIYEMKLRGKDPFDVPPVSDATVAANEQFWTSCWDKELAALTGAPARRNQLMGQMSRIGLAPAPRLQDRGFADWCSIPLDAWGVALQKQGHWREAQVRFEQALQLNTNNLSARLNLACNTNFQAGVKMGLADVAQVASQLGSLDKLNLLLVNGGPLDEPTMVYLLGTLYLDRGLLIQAAEQLERTRVFVPEALASEMGLAEIYNRLHLPERSRPLISHIREQSRNLPADNQLDLNLALLDSYSWLQQTNAENARNALRSVVAQHPNDPQVISRVLAAYLAFGDLTNALQLAEVQLASTPDDVASLNNKAVVLMQLGRAAEALPVFDRLLTLTNSPAAQINRAFALIAKGDFTAAEKDLRQLEKTESLAGMVNFGFAAVAEHRHDTNQLTHYLQLCLSNAAPGTPLWQQATAHLRALNPAASTNEQPSAAVKPGVTP